jgi:hypothetical protein
MLRSRLALGALVIASAACVGSTGCGLVNVSGVPGAPKGARKGGSEPGKAAGGGEDASAGSGGEDGDALADAYDASGLTDCEAKAECGEELRKRAGIKPGKTESGTKGLFNPVRAKMKNLDPEWLPGWGEMSKSDSYDDVLAVYAELSQAAARKAFRKSCGKTFKTLSTKWAAEETQQRAKVDEAKGASSLMQRVATLYALRDDEAKAFADPYLGFVGRRYSLEVGILGAFVGSKHAYAYAPLPDKIVRELRPRLQDDVEEIVFCRKAAERGYQGVKKFEERDAYHVRPLFTKDEIARAKRELEAAKTASEELFPAKADGKAIESTSFASAANKKGFVDAPEVGTPGELVLKVEKVDTKDGKTLVTIKHESEDMETLGCVRTNRIARVRDDGTLEYEEKCQTARRVHRTVGSVVMVGLPAGTEILPGDQLGGFYKVLKLATKDGRPGGVHTIETSVELQLDYLEPRQVKRAKKP